jgi:hypothetical protein
MTTSNPLSLFYVEYIKKAPNAAFKSCAFDFLRIAGDDVTSIGKEEMAKTPGLVITLGAILDPSSNNRNNIEAATGDAANKLMKNLF